MKPLRLSLRLGISVGAMGAMLVIIVALSIYLTLAFQLDSIAKNDLKSKLIQIEHSLKDDANGNTLADYPHTLYDIVMGHDNLDLAVYGLYPQLEELINIGKNSSPSYLSAIAATENPRFQSWTNETGLRYLTVSKAIELDNDVKVKVLLSLDRTQDIDLIYTSLKAALFFLPFLLILISAGTWFIVQRGLAPLTKFSQIASRVSTRDLTHRIADDKLPQELSELAKAINFMLNRLDDGVQQLSQFSDDLAHELRSPISNLMGVAQVTLSKKRPPEEYKNVLECCVEELERVSHIVSDMLFLAQTGSLTSLPPFEFIRLEEEAASVIDLLNVIAEEKKITLNMAGTGVVHGNRLMIQRAIYNILSNAINHASIHSNVQVTIGVIRKSIVLSVENLGDEIPQEHLPYLFERFYRIDESRSRIEGGTGLGLAIVKSIMTLHGGKAKVSSKPEGIIVFYLEFPNIQ